MSNNYENARDMSWRVLIDCRITKLPIDFSEILKHYNLNLVTYSDCQLIKYFK